MKIRRILQIYLTAIVTILFAPSRIAMPQESALHSTICEVVMFEDDTNELVSPDAKIDLLASGFEFCEHGDRRISRLEKEGGKRTLADSYMGKRTSNCAWGNDESVLYMTVDDTLCRIQTKTMGAETRPKPLPDATHKGLILDLDADYGIKMANGRVASWENQADFKAKAFIATRDASHQKGTGHPMLKEKVATIGGHNAVVFKRQELINSDEDAFDHLITGSGYTWFAVMSVYLQVSGLKDVNSFFGNLKNGGNYEGFWAGLKDDNTLWIGSRNGITFGRWDQNNPQLLGPRLQENRYYVIAGRMGAGTGEVTIELFVNETKPVASVPFPVNPKANSSKMAIGQERDATNHPGHESFDGELARLLIWERPLSDPEFETVLSRLLKTYKVKESEIASR